MTHWSGPDVWCLAFGYGLQLFFDFAGILAYRDRRGAKALGITVPENFDRPFASTTPSIFWTRWHMSLSFWIRDYVLLAAGHHAPRNLVAQSRPGHFHGAVRPVAQSQPAFPDLGRLSRRVCWCCTVTCSRRNAS